MPRYKTQTILNLKELQEAAKLTIHQLAARSGVSAGTITNARAGKPLQVKKAEAILNSLRGQGSAPAANGSAPQSQALVVETEDGLVTAFKLLLEQLDERIERIVKRVLVAEKAAIQLERRQPELVRSAAPPVTYVPPPPKEPEVLVTQAGAISHGFPVTMAVNNWAIRYERKFLKGFEVSGLEGPIRAALQRFAQLGEQYSGLSFKKMEVGAARSNKGRWSGAQYAFRINQRWRVLVRKDNGDKAYTITVLAHHDEIE